MTTVRFVVLWWLALAGWWVLLVGTNAGLEEIAGACAATLGTLLALAIRRQRLLAFRFERRWLARASLAPLRMVEETGVILWALGLHVLRVRPVRSAYRAFAFPAGRQDSVSAGRRGLMTLADALGPNTTPVDMDCEAGLVLRHELDPRHASDTLP